MSAVPKEHRPQKHFNRLIYFLPLGIALILGVALAKGLTLDPNTLPSALLGRQVPEFDLPPVKGRMQGLSSTDLKGEVSLVNVFASWCVACREEHPVFMKLARDGTVPLHGLNYKDQPDDAAEWLDSLGDPYTRTGADINGRVAIDWGVYGVPATFVVDAKGNIAYKHVGPVTEKVLAETILPRVEKLRNEASGAGTAEAPR